MTPGFADGAVEADNFTVPVHLPDGDAAGVPDPGRQQTAHTGENHAAGDMLFPAKGFDGFHQVVAPAQPDAVESGGAFAGDYGTVHTGSSFFFAFLYIICQGMNGVKAWKKGDFPENMGKYRICLHSFWGYDMIYKHLTVPLAEQGIARREIRFSAVSLCCKEDVSCPLNKRFTLFRSREILCAASPSETVISIPL
jgi:hypothetical protein